MQHVRGDMAFGSVVDLPVDAGPAPLAEPVCDGCGRPSPCAAAEHAVRAELAAEFAWSYAGL
ncbi:hypothetical protein Cs7R123_43320 [Catellatospora sp. TT07R-123]|uniref:hypothetical protein n=1 Tax=Catellatospora sp. TT07R-123 TaxID=2733863 RepID=UPI001B14636D|nr:hypothetical protein [Catellatospora sp. TT07R-123]GHJ46990.1 hypothetical protein Cs7R123_43320 [Catellatospora sp. TT07R-123]